MDCIEAAFAASIAFWGLKVLPLESNHFVAGDESHLPALVMSGTQKTPSHLREGPAEQAGFS